MFHNEVIPVHLHSLFVNMVQYFFDCNPSFSSYTELAIIAADRLIVPCTADNASVRGLQNMFNLLYDNQNNELFVQFSENVSNNNIELPKIHRVVQNKSRSHEQNASKAFRVNLENIEIILKRLHEEKSEKFTDGSQKVWNIKDGNTLAIVINHTGQMLSDIKAGPHVMYGSNVQVDANQIKYLREDLDKLLIEL